MVLRYIAAAVSAALLLAGCGSGGESSPREDMSSAASVRSEAGESVQERTVSLGELCAEITASDEKTFTGSARMGESPFDSNCKKLYRCELSELTDGLIVYNSSGGLADEVSVIRRGDGDTAAAEKQLSERRDVRYNDFEGYAPDELPKIKNGLIFSEGGYSVLIISKNAAGLEKTVRERLSQRSE